MHDALDTRKLMRELSLALDEESYSELNTRQFLVIQRVRNECESHGPTFHEYPIII